MVTTTSGGKEWLLRGARMEELCRAARRDVLAARRHVRLPANIIAFPSAGEGTAPSPARYLD
jgi:hypothetical protein